MEKYKFDENNGLWYELQGDYYLPCLKLPEKEQPHIGIWGQRHLRYLKKHHRVCYANLLTSGKSDGCGGGHNGATESHRPNGLGRQNEQHTKSSY